VALGRAARALSERMGWRDREVSDLTSGFTDFPAASGKRQGALAARRRGKL
jgi:hypothetical protein